MILAFDGLYRWMKNGRGNASWETWLEIISGGNFFIRAKAILALLTKSAGFYLLCRGVKWLCGEGAEYGRRTDSGTRCAGGAAEVLEEALGF